VSSFSSAHFPTTVHKDYTSKPYCLYFHPFPQLFKRQVKAKGNAVRSSCSQHLQGLASTNWMCISCQGGNYQNCKKQITQNSAMTQNLAAPLFEPFPRSLQSHPPINNSSAHLYIPSPQLCNLTMHEIVVLVDTLDQRLKKPKTKWVRRWCKRWAQRQRV